MEKSDLYRMMDSAGVPRKAYSLEGGLEDDTLCFDERSGWSIVYYSEKGEEHFIGKFNRDYDALLFLAAKLLEDYT